MKIFGIRFTLEAIAYIRAENEAEAKKIGLEFEDKTSIINDLPAMVSYLPYGDKKLPDFSFSPAVTVQSVDLDHIEHVD